MSKEREFLKKLRYASLLENDLRKELEELLAQPEHIEDKFDRVKSNREFYQAGYAEAELKLKPEQEQEPVAWMWEEEGDEGCVETTIDINKPRVNMYRENIRPLYIAPPVKSEHIEDKLAMFAPVGYLYKQMDCYGEWATIFKVDKPYITWHDIKDIVPLYTSPKKREPLSDEEITKAFMQSDFGTWDSKSYRSGFRDAEKCHGIGGE